MLVSRLGVIKLCDFGFARPYLENETFTDYVATRWYRSPELLVGDPRYGKEVDIWAVGCLYSEMMTGEPLFPGESDIDQLFQIVRVLGKLNARHQILIMRNAMFKGMKQEQNTSLQQLFPEWNRDCLDFLTDCLKMDGAVRPDTATLLNHDLFVRDNFLESFLAELRTKLSQEMQVNPLLSRIPSYGSGRKGSDEKQRITNTKKSGDSQKLLNGNKDKSNQINLSLLSSQLAANKTNIQPNSTLSNNTSFNGNNNVNTSHNNISNSTHNNSNNSTNNGNFNISVNTNMTTKNNNNNNIFNNNNTNSVNNNSNSNSNNNSTDNTEEMNIINLSSLKQYLNGNSITTTNNLPPKSKQISINNLVFKENAKYPRILSAKATKTTNGDKLTENISTNAQSNTFDMQILPPSPIPFQSLQPENYSIAGELPQNKRLSPVNNNANSNTTTTTGINGFSVNGAAPQYFTNYRRSSNILNLQQMAAAQKTKAIQAQATHLPAPARSNAIAKRERERTNHHILDVSLVPIGFNNNVAQPDSTNYLNANNHSHNHHLTKEPSPRILPPPPWLTGNLKMTAQGKTTQIANNSKKRITDWKSVGSNGTNNSNRNHANENVFGSGGDLVLPNCPGATISPQKTSNTTKKKLSPISTLSESTNVFGTPVGDKTFIKTIVYIRA